MTGELSSRTSRGALVNLAFAAVIQAIALVQGVVVPRLLGPHAIGLFALATGGVAVGRALKEFGLPKKVVQERDVDLHTSYGVAFTLELVLAGVFTVVVLLIAPVLAWAYDRPELWLLTSVLTLQLFATAFLELPAAIPYRELRFVRRNLIQAIGPVVMFMVTVPLAFAGLGVWALAAGSVAGFLAAVVTVLSGGTLRPRLAWDRALVRRYVSFGWPLWLSTLVTTAAGWGAVFVVSATIGVHGLGFFQLAHGWGQRPLVVHAMLADALFPALVTIQGARSRLQRAFVVSNQLAMLLSSAAGLGLVLFAEPLLRLLLGPAWLPAVPLVQAQGVAVLVGSIGFNWDTFLAASGRTRPQLTMSLLGTAWVFAVALPMLAVWGVKGGAAAVCISSVATLAVRQRYVRRWIGSVWLPLIVWRQVAGASAAAAIVLGARWAGWEAGTVRDLAGQVALFLAASGVLGLATTRGPLSEVWRAARRRTALRVPAAVVAASSSTAAPEEPAWQLHPTPRPSAFPLGVRVDDRGLVWVTTRDQPAIGRHDPSTGGWRWTPMPPYPHIPSPDGHGGCWSALTRSSALAHVDADGRLATVALPTRSKELLATAVVDLEVWMVDGARRGLWRHAVDGAGGPPEFVALPPPFRRPDIVVAASSGTVLVGDTHAPVAGIVDQGGIVDVWDLPHPTRWLLPDDAGLWLGASGRPCLTRVRWDRTVDLEVELPAPPFDIARLPGGRIVAAVKDADMLAVVDESGRQGTFPLPASSWPMGIAVAGGWAWVTLAATSHVAQLSVEALDAVFARPVNHA